MAPEYSSRYPIVEKLLGEQRRFLVTVDRLEAFVARPHPGGMTCLAALRWTFSREMLVHFSHVESLVLQPLMADRRAPVAAIAARSSLDLRNVYDIFMRHVQRWNGLPPAEQWEEYRHAIGLLVRRMRVRLLAQEKDIYPLLPLQPGGIRVHSAHETPNYAAEAWRLRSLIYAGGLDPHETGAMAAMAQRA